MFLKVIGCLCFGFLIFGVQSQRSWGYNGGYNSGFSNSWNSNNGFSVNNNRPSSVNNNNAGNWGSNSFSNIGRPNEKLSNDKNSKWGYETTSNTDNSGWNQNNPSTISNGQSPSWQQESSKPPNEKKPPNNNLPSSSNWNSNSNTEDNNLPFSPFGSNNAKPSGQSSSQNSNSGDWFSNNGAKENEIITDSDYEDNSLPSPWGSNNKKKSKPTTKPFSGSGNRETTTQKNSKNSGTSKWDKNTNKKPQRPSGSNSWDTSTSSLSGKEESQGNVKPQEENQSSAVDTSILDELDKNDWYFGKESNYPKPPLQSSLNIDVSELWNFDKNKKSNQNFRGNNNNNNKNSNNNRNEGSNNNNNNNNNSNNNKKKINNSNNNSRGSNNNNNNNNRRRNRQTETTSIQCECVNVNLCEEEDMILTQEDIQFDFRPLEEFRCEKLTDVCCTDPKLQLSSRANIEDEEKKELRCGERRLYGEPFQGLGDNIAEPGEFPWNLRLENAEFNCSASLIHHKLALTVAHCVTGAQPGELTVTAGIWNSKNEPSQSRKVTQIIPHPDYNSRNPRNDIALLVLETPFELTDNVNTICLPVTNDKWDSNQCVVAGWKPEEIHGQVLEVLEKGVVNFLPQPECQNIMLVTDLWRNYVFHDSFVCGWEKSGKKSCTGDEGGFVICPSKKRPGTYLQIGIVSKGMNCDEFGRPGIFTNVLKFLDWINENYFELGLYDDIDIRSFAESQ